MAPPGAPSVAHPASTHWVVWALCARKNVPVIGNNPQWYKQTKNAGPRGLHDTFTFGRTSKGSVPMMRASAPEKATWKFKEKEEMMTTTSYMTHNILLANAEPHKFGEQPNRGFGTLNGTGYSWKYSRVSAYAKDEPNAMHYALLCRDLRRFTFVAFRCLALALVCFALPCFVSNCFGLLCFAAFVLATLCFAWCCCCALVCYALL